MRGNAPKGIDMISLNAPDQKDTVLTIERVKIVLIVFQSMNAHDHLAVIVHLDQHHVASVNSSNLRSQQPALSVAMLLAYMIKMGVMAQEPQLLELS